ncbi:hypothetical protein SAMN05421819_2373 [Bryocella elongata]|uniref:Uncharacterized protein n=1 Tax=Bryocella elongata TaxID=863522 RepID=A0A1H5YN37_9BACT|nr:hypothetical protein [Bryocella elongata]SEG24786.1 hypothetical protein SAMN05421819_2373 [Bryocella elongata]
MSIVGVGLGALASLLGCRTRSYTPPEEPMPANAVLLSQMMREDPAFDEQLIASLAPDKNAKGKHGPVLMTPELIDELRTRLLGKDWSGLDRFPGWTMKRITPTVRVVGHVAGKDAMLEKDSEVKPGSSPQSGGADAMAKHSWLDVGEYALDKEQTISLDAPSTLKGFSLDGQITDLGHGVTRGDGPNEFAPEHAESERLAYVLNRLAGNGIEGMAQASVRFHLTTDPHAKSPALYDPTMGGAVGGDIFIPTPAALIQTLANTGHTVEVIDARYFANFAHMHYKGANGEQDVMAPFWIDSGVEVPNAHGRHLLVPVSHAELEWKIRGPKINADVSWYFGVDGKAEWRVMDTLDQAWVLKRAAHTYTGAQAIEATRLASVATVAYTHLHEVHGKIPFGGYFAFGVCQDVVSAIEKKLTGKVTLFPNTADNTFFTDARDAEFNAMMREVPKDRDAKGAEPERIFGSLPAAPDENGHFSAITIPGLADDLNVTYAAWKDGSLQTELDRSARIKTILFFGAALGVGIYLAVKTRRFLDRQPVQRKRL